MDLSTYKRISINGIPMKKIEIGGVEAWRRPFVNWVPLSIDTDGSVYNGTGYIDGYRLNSSGGTSSQQQTTTTGYIPCKSTDVIRMGGLSYIPITGYTYISFYDSSFSLLGTTNIASISATEYSTTQRGIVKLKDSNIMLPTVENGITTLDHYTFTDGSKVAYFRINGQCDWNTSKGGKDLIITINEEIK